MMDGMLRLSSITVQNDYRVRDELHAQTVEHLGDPDSVLATEAIGSSHHGVKSTVLQRQYSKDAGSIESCRLGVFRIGRADAALRSRTVPISAPFTSAYSLVVQAHSRSRLPLNLGSGAEVLRMSDWMVDPPPTVTPAGRSCRSCVPSVPPPNPTGEHDTAHHLRCAPTRTSAHVGAPLRM